MMTAIWSDDDNILTICFSGVSSMLSIFGAVIIFGTYCAIPDIQNFTRKLILCLTMADTLTALGILIAVVRYTIVSYTDPTDESELRKLSPVCVAQSFVTTFSTLVSFFLTVFIALHLSTSVVYNERQTETTMMFLIYNVISWIVPAIIVSFALSYGALGEDDATAGPWCWINDNVQNPMLWMLLTGKGFEIACYLITVSIFVLMKFYMYLRHRRERFSAIRTTLRNEDQNFLYIWLILVALRIWGTIRFFISIFSENNSQKLLWYNVVLLHIQAIGDPAQGFFNCILFCILDAPVRKKLLYFCRCCCQRKHLEDEPLLSFYSSNQNELYGTVQIASPPI